MLRSVSSTDPTEFASSCRAYTMMMNYEKSKLRICKSSAKRQYQHLNIRYLVSQATAPPQKESPPTATSDRQYNILGTNEACKNRTKAKVPTFLSLYLIFPCIGGRRPSISHWRASGIGLQGKANDTQHSARKSKLSAATGKLADILINEGDFQLCARATRADAVPEKHNAGHSIVANGVSLDFHMLPSGLVSPSCMSLIGSGVVFHGISRPCGRCYAAVDGLEEIELGERKIGTTGRGIGPSYSTKAARSGIRVHEIFDEESFERKLRKLADGCRKRFGDLLEYDVEDEIRRFRDYRPKLAEFCVDAVHLVQMMQKHNAKILVEGANALMLDIDYGTYPYVTSSNTGLGGVFTGLAIHPKKIDHIIGVVKAYTTRVGEGIFKTEDDGEVGTKLQTIGREWGASTGRKRRCGWIDLVVLKYSTAVNHYTRLNLSKLDVLDTFPVIKQEDLPKQAIAYVKLIEEHCSVPIAWIGTGPGREDMIIRPIPVGI
ncbi:hypothetical protein CHU98_g1650 [Xylaria longipes]|nr:hypothetical protein CHU98_g1650 [Xylaria longipes]